MTAYRHALTIALALGTLPGVAMAENKTVPEVKQTQFTTVPESIRNYRYCEIVPIFRTRLTFTAEVYNTIGLNECPADLWNALSKEALMEAYGAMDVKMNGPRYWVINKVEAKGEEATDKTVDFVGIEMILRAKIETKLWEGSVGGKLYADNEVQRITTYTYNAGEMVYELTSADGSIYRMQSYAQFIDPNLTIDGLEDLGKRLTLPEGWSYKARVLEAETLLSADGVAYVVNDDLGNSYQKVIEK